MDFWEDRIHEDLLLTLGDNYIIPERSSSHLVTYIKVSKKEKNAILMKNSK